MKKLCLLLAALCALLLPTLAVAGGNTLPSEVEKYFSTSAFKGCSFVDDTTVLAGGQNNWCFVIIRDAKGARTLYAFRQKNGQWKHQFHTKGAVMQTAHGLQLQSGLSYYDDAAQAVRDIPCLQIAQLNSEGEYWEYTATFVLENNSWRLRTLKGYSPYCAMSFRESSITYYDSVEFGRAVGTVRGTVQRELSSVSLSAIPKTFEEAKRKLTVATTLPDSDSLQAEEIRFAGGKKYDVHAAPDSSSPRGESGRASVSTNGWIQVFGEEDGWLLIQYAIDASRCRFGYISAKALPKNTSVKPLDFYRREVTLLQDTAVTDDPLYSRSALAQVSKGEKALWLATLGSDAYLELNLQGTPLRGFVPLTAIACEAEEKLPAPN